MSPAVLRERLCRLEERFGRGFLDTDPVGLVRRFDRAEDRELVGLLSAGLAYGRVGSIRSSVESLLRILGPRPSLFLESFRPRVDARRFDGFVHRFTRGRDVALLLHLVRQARERHGSLEALYRARDPEPSAPDVGAGMIAFVEALFSGDARPFASDGRVPRNDGARWLLPSPANGSPCKRHCLFLRWMIRPDDGVDCGVWRSVPASRLVVPLDVHVRRIAGALGWTRRKSPSWEMAREVTASLRRLDPLDPARYDFALSRLGVLGRLRAPGGRLTARRIASLLDTEARIPVRRGAVESSDEVHGGEAS